MSTTPLEEIGFRHHFSNVDELFQWLLGERFLVSNLYESGLTGRRGYLFRGLNSVNYSNLPSSHRNETPLRYFSTRNLPKFDASDTSLEKRREYVSRFSREELRCVHLFLENADRLGVNTPVDYAQMKANLINYFPKKIIKARTSNDCTIHDSLDICSSLLFNSDFPSRESFEIFALAQHHGVPTRLLDWSENPLVALFFAAYKASSACFCHERTNSQSDLALWYIRQKVAFHAGLLLATVSRNRNNYLFSQQGVFLIYPRANEYFVMNGHWPSLENLMAKYSDLSNDAQRKTGCEYGRVTIAHKYADEILRKLYHYGITRSSLMPSLDNIAHSIPYQRALFSDQ